VTTEDALGFAVEIINSYEMDCQRLPQYLADGNDPAGFCKGHIYRDALADIERLRNRERLSQYATVNHCRALLQGTNYMVVHEVDLDRPCYHCGSPSHRQTHATAERVAEEQMESDETPAASDEDGTWSSEFMGGGLGIDMGPGRFSGGIPQIPPVYLAVVAIILFVFVAAWLLRWIIG
jgi:hypothetical protein